MLAKFGRVVFQLSLCEPRTAETETQIRTHPEANEQIVMQICTVSLTLYN